MTVEISTRLDRAAILVADIERAKACLADWFGIDCGPTYVDLEAGVNVTVPDAEGGIELVSFLDGAPPRRRGADDVMSHEGVVNLVFTVPDLEATRRHLEGHGLSEWGLGEYRRGAMREVVYDTSEVFGLMFVVQERLPPDTDLRAEVDRHHRDLAEGHSPS